MATDNKDWLAMIGWLKTQKSEWSKMALHHLALVDDLRQAMIDAEQEAHELSKICEQQTEILIAVGMVADVVGKAARRQAQAQEVLDVVLLDTAPFRNLMSTVYGLDPLGQKPVKKRKAKT